MDTNWRIDAFTGEVRGIDYPALAVVIEMLDLDRRKAFLLLRSMERAALEEFRCLRAGS